MSFDSLAKDLAPLHDPQAIVERALAQAVRPVVSTSFGPLAAATLHLVTRLQPDIPVLWVDSGYNTQATYRFAADLIDKLGLNMHIYVPATTVGFRAVMMSGVPSVDDPRHAEFTQEVKIEPFERALSELKPDLWISGIRADETEHRQSLGVLSRGRHGVAKVAPFYHRSEAQVLDYIEQHDLPQERRYFDPTKVWEGRECGLHQ